MKHHIMVTPASFVVIKHSWRGKYRRVLTLGRDRILTVNPNTMEVTHSIPYEDVISICPSMKNDKLNEFKLMYSCQQKKITFTFYSDYRSEILSIALRHYKKFSSYVKGKSKIFIACKEHWSGTRLPIALEVMPGCLVQLEPTTLTPLAFYDYNEIDRLHTVSDVKSGIVIVCNNFERKHMFILNGESDIIKDILDYSKNFVGITLKCSVSISIEEFRKSRLGKFSSDEHLTSLAEFPVQKLNHRHVSPVHRIFCLTESCIVERDCSSYNVCNLHPYNEVYCLIRDESDQQRFTILFINRIKRTYLSSDRDSLLATLLDGTRTSGNKDVHVMMNEPILEHRIGSFGTPVEEETETLHLKFLQEPPAGWTPLDLFQRFNLNISYAGLMYDSLQEGLFVKKGKFITDALKLFVRMTNNDKSVMEAQFGTLRRLLSSKPGFSAFTSVIGLREKIGSMVMECLKSNDPSLLHASLDVLGALMAPMHAEYDLKHEQLNKMSLLSSTEFLDHLITMWSNHVISGTGALVVTSFLDFITFALCPPYNETTDGAQFDKLLMMIAQHGYILYRLLQHPSFAIVKGSGLVIKALIEEGPSEVSKNLQQMSLSMGALPHHLKVAMFTDSNDIRLLTHRELSRQLINLWTLGNEEAMSLLARIIPPRLLTYLDSNEVVKDNGQGFLPNRDTLSVAQQQSTVVKPKSDLINNQLRQVEKALEAHVQLGLKHWRNITGRETSSRLDEYQVVLRKSRNRKNSKLKNWSLFYHQFNIEHGLPDLIWNFKTREELRESLDSELRNFARERQHKGNDEIAWNYEEFEVNYPSLSDEIKIGNYFLRILLEMGEKSPDMLDPIMEPQLFFNELYHRFLLSPKMKMKAMCLQAMTIVYKQHPHEIGYFSDTKYLVAILDRTCDYLERDHIILCLQVLLENPDNLKLFLNCGGIKILVELATLSHFFVARQNHIIESNQIEASVDMERDEKEWYIEKDGSRHGPISLKEMKDAFKNNHIDKKTKVWAQGCDGWKSLYNVCQLKWCLCATGQALLTEKDIASIVVDILISACSKHPSRNLEGAVIRPLPRPKRLLSDDNVLTHLCQLLLTFDSKIVEKVSVLLSSLLVDNPVISKAYLTGIFFFLLMYTGYNVMPVAELLFITHKVQASSYSQGKFRTSAGVSVLTPMLPTAMICYLNNYGPVKFAEIFLGEFDTPEVIWSSEMRRLLIQKIATHLADFTPKLSSNASALYQYCPIPSIQFPQLEDELFCGGYYLKHLCDTVKFPDWNIRNPVQLLHDILDQWNLEINKEPPSMSLQEALDILGLQYDPNSHLEDSVIRKAYFLLAQKYHPDKNPTGRDMFEKVNCAYEFICSRKNKDLNGPCLENLTLLIDSQCILFQKYSEDLKSYKYSGYPMLVSTISNEVNDDGLFAKSDSLLSPATNLAYHTIHCSALNSEELCREKGFEALVSALVRCSSTVGLSSKSQDLAVQVCLNVTKCFDASSQFEVCQQRLQDMKHFYDELMKFLSLRHLTEIQIVTCHCIASLATTPQLQSILIKQGVVWFLLHFLFDYDYTLDEGGVAQNEMTNKQAQVNKLSKTALEALRKLCCSASEDRSILLNALNVLLTPYLTNQMLNSEDTQALKLLNTDSATPYILWNHLTRVELFEFLKSQQCSQRKLEVEIDVSKEFQLSIHQEELVVCHIFVRLYNASPNFSLHNPPCFMACLFGYLQDKMLVVSRSDNPNSLNSLSEKLSHMIMCLHAVHNIILHNPGCEIGCMGHFTLLLSMLRFTGHHDIHEMILKIVLVTLVNPECVKDMCGAQVMGYLLLQLSGVPQNQVALTLTILQSLVSTTPAIKELSNKGLLIYLLDLFCNHGDADLRLQCAELLAKFSNDKLVGPRISLILGHFLPPIFLDAMRDAPPTSLSIFDTNHENPELIWNQTSRDNTRNTITNLKDKFYNKQLADPMNALFNTPEEFAYEHFTGEIIVGGIYLRLFIQNPSWVVRKPREFLTSLLDTCFYQMDAKNPDLELLQTATSALVLLLEAQPLLLEEVPALGHLSRLVKIMDNYNSAAIGPCITMFGSLAKSRTCVSSFSNTNLMKPIYTVMKTRKDLIYPCVEALYNCFSFKIESLVRQAVDENMIDFFLSMLSNADPNIENISSVRAYIVKSLKAMCDCGGTGDRVHDVLNASSVWSQYKDQKHDLFLASSQGPGYLTGPSVAGYLTQDSRTSNIIQSPPPITS